MVLMLAVWVNALRVPALRSSAKALHRVGTRTRLSCGDSLLRALGELEGSPLGLARVSEDPAIQPDKTMRRGKKAETFRIAHHDAGCL